MKQDVNKPDAIPVLSHFAMKDHIFNRDKGFIYNCANLYKHLKLREQEKFIKTKGKLLDPETRDFKEFK